MPSVGRSVPGFCGPQTSFNSWFGHRRIAFTEAEPDTSEKPVTATPTPCLLVEGLDVLDGQAVRGAICNCFPVITDFKVYISLLIGEVGGVLEVSTVQVCGGGGGQECSFQKCSSCTLG